LSSTLICTTRQPSSDRKHQWWMQSPYSFPSHECKGSPGRKNIGEKSCALKQQWRKHREEEEEMTVRNGERVGMPFFLFVIDLLRQSMDIRKSAPPRGKHLWWHVVTWGQTVAPLTLLTRKKRQSYYAPWFPCDVWLN
jgi:hypothetical protein